ncbi:unnamed protein product [Cyprideis torosa]|uniref:Mitochondrial inner membrane protease ATP23 n=1 Tax=Cyprideis torosa TaxID=163714 RepID=A0A7R8ZHS1_9CRUS|nr:unnamed protein product [Cyprideis torosa]CAG0883133.1 unnamed protein product [Cyprideis torosa]
MFAGVNMTQWGYDMYPERPGSHGQKPGFFKTYFFGQSSNSYYKTKCEVKICKAMDRNPLVRLMMDALEASGCPVNPRRHFSCELCHGNVSGGYDPKHNQIVICHNHSRNEGIIAALLTHEMIHMFDACRNKFDFDNPRHIACSEIRAANLTHCSFLAGVWDTFLSPFTVKQQHEQCVKAKAVYSLLAVRDVDPLEAMKVVDEVFPKCYNDMEPIGRRIRRNSYQAYEAYDDRRYFGYYPRQTKQRFVPPGYGDKTEEPTRLWNFDDKKDAKSTQIP